VTAEAAAGDASIAGARVRKGTRREGKRVGEERQRSGRVGVLPWFDWTILGRPDRPIESAQLTSDLFFLGTNDKKNQKDKINPTKPFPIDKP
jgi:hypothetical protein